MRKLNEQAISQYVETIRNLFEMREFEQRRLIITPFTRPDGEYIELELMPQDDGKVLITDNCSTVDYLFVNGVDVERLEFRALLSLITRGFGIEISEEEIYKDASIDSLGYDFHRVLNAILGISFLIYRGRLPQLRGLPQFRIRVREFLKITEIPYEPVHIKGKLITHPFLCVRGESLIEPVTADTEHKALQEAMILGFKWIDVKAGGNKYRKIAIIDIDDAESKKAAYWKNGPIKILDELSDKVVPWYERESLEKVLLAQA
jgi:hypothetical protein